MALTDKLTAEKAGLESYLDSERGAKLEQNQIERLEVLNSLLGASSGGGGGSITNYATETGGNLASINTKLSAKATSTTTTTVASSATSVSLLDANSNRKFASFRNDSTATAYIELGATATTSSVYRLEAQGFLSLDNYTGAISCIWASANGNMRISEGE